MHTSFHLNTYLDLFPSRHSLSEEENNKLKVFPNGQTSFKGSDSSHPTGVLGAKNVHCEFSEPGGVPPGGVPLKCLETLL